VRQKKLATEPYISAKEPYISAKQPLDMWRCVTIVRVSTHVKPLFILVDIFVGITHAHTYALY